jgi:hypothetical protein
MKNLFSGILLALIVLAGAGCSGNSKEKMPGESAYDQPATETSAAADSSAQQMAYICPMECEGSASNEPGKCPVCGMELVKNPNYKGTAPDSADQHAH